MPRPANTTGTVQDSATIVWLPLNFPGKNVKTEFTALGLDQLEIVAESFGARQEELVSPEPLGVRQVFSWRLANALSRRRGPGLDQFALLVEGLLYGLLETETYDLQQFDLDFDNPEERYLSILKFRSSAGAEATVAGSFSPDTLVCPAANWRQKDDLEDRVQDCRYDVGTRARALARRILNTFPAPQMLWHQALSWLLEEYPTGREESPANQRNVGPFFIRTGPSVRPRLMFFPQYCPEYIPHLVQCFNSGTLHNGEFEHQGRKVAAIRLPMQSNNPKVFGSGNVSVIERDHTRLPLVRTLEGAAKKIYIDAVQPIVNLYELELEDPNRDLLVPDSLRAGMYAWGGPSEFIRVPWLYGPGALRADLQPAPHQISTDRGAYHQGSDFFYVSTTPDRRLVFHVQTLHGKQVGELTALGFALWKIFCGVPWDDRQAIAAKDGITYLMTQGGWIGAPLGLDVVPPDAVTESVKWATFLALPGKAPDDLFRTAAQAYIDQFNLAGITAKERVLLDKLSLVGYEWWQAHAV